MKFISDMVQSLSQEEQQQFINFQKAKNRRGDTKNLLLFKKMAGGQTNNLANEIYGKDHSSALHALTNRLQNSLIDFLAQNSFAKETNDEMECLRLLLAARVLFERKVDTLALKTLKKAEERATNLDAYAVLTEIYHTKIQYAHKNRDNTLLEDIAQSKLNLNYLQQEQKVNMVYALIKQEPHPSSISKKVQQAFHDADIDLGPHFTYKSLYQLLALCFTMALATNDHYSAYPLIKELFSLAQEKKESKTKHSHYYLSILSLGAHAHFRNKNFEPSLKVLDEMESLINLKKELSTKPFKEKWSLLKALNLNYLGQWKTAVQLLENDTNAPLDHQLTKAMLFFQQNDWGQAYGIIKKMHHSDKWYEQKMGYLWTIKKSIMELLLLMERDELDLVISRFKSLEKKHFNRLKHIGQERVITFLRLAKQYYERPEEVTSAQFQTTVDNSFEWVGIEQEDVFAISFYAWLKSKMQQLPLYEVTLKLINNA